MASSIVSGKNTAVMSSSSCEPFHCPPLAVGERVVWLGKELPESGTVKWIGMLPSVSTDGWSAGIELDNSVGDTDGHWGGQELFKCPAYHGIVIDVKGLIKETDFLGKESNGHGSGTKKNIKEIERLSNKGASMTKKTLLTAASTSTISNDILNVSNSVASTSRSSDADEVLGGIITTHSTPASCMGSFDRRVYARMFAECEVEKWYEALNYAPPNYNNGPFDVSTRSLESKNEIERKLSSAVCAKVRKKSSTLDGGCQLTTPKKERGGIFRFFRWLSGRSSSRKAPGDSKKHRRNTNVPELRRGGRTKSLESVTSLSRSFHYIPVGVLCSENDVAQHNDVNSSIEVLNEEDVNQNETKIIKSASLSRAMADERERDKSPRSTGNVGSGVESRRHSKQSICPSGSNSPGSNSNASRKKRKAPLPPTSTPRNYWVKVLPSTPIAENQPGPSHHYELQTGSTRSVDSVNSKHGKVNSYSKNKRQAPAPPRLITSAEINTIEDNETTINVTSEVKTENIHEIKVENHDEMNIEAVVSQLSCTTDGKAENFDKNDILKVKLESDSSPAESSVVKEKKDIVKVYTEDHLENKMESNDMNHDQPNDSIALENDVDETIASGYNRSVENTKLDVATTENKVVVETKLEHNIKSESEQLPNNLTINSDDVNLAAKLAPKLNAQMNIQALQELVESLVLQYCEASSKLEDVKSTDKNSTTITTVGNKFQKIKNIKAEEEVEEPNYENSNVQNNKDNDLAAKLMERWQLRMREELLNLDTDIVDQEKKPKWNETKTSKNTLSSSTKDLNGSSDGSIYEPIDNHMRHRYNRRHSIDEFSGNRSPSSRKPPSGRRRMSSSSTTATDEETTGKIITELGIENTEEDFGADPFAFWRELDSKEQNGSPNSSKSAKSIRRLSVNGQRQSMSSAQSHGKQLENNDYDQFTPMAYTNYGYASVYRHLNWPPPPNPQVLSMSPVHHANSAQFVFPYANHYSPYLLPNPSHYFPFASTNYAQTALDTCFTVDPTLDQEHKLKSSDDHLQRNDYRLAADKNRRCRQSNVAFKNAEETKSGKKLHHSDYSDDTNNITPPPPPPRTNGNCSSRLAASCQWLKASGKSVEEKVQAARNEENVQTPEKSNDYHRYGNKNKSRVNDSPPSPAAIRARRWPLATLENSVVIGGVRVKTPLNLWPLEYELIVPELKRLKARLEGKPLPEDEIALDDASDLETLAINKLLNELELAICNGNLDEAAARARDLAQLKIQCTVTRNRQQMNKNDNEDTSPSDFSDFNSIIVNMYVEDKISHYGPIPIKVMPSMTIGQLKLKMFKEFEFPVHVQRWILGQRLASDDDVQLAAFGVVSDGFPVYLYLLTVGLNDFIGRRKESLVDAQPDDRLKNTSRSQDRTKSSSKTKKEKRTGIARTKATGPVSGAPELQPSQQKSKADADWPCKKCTLINPSARNSCIMCGSNKPAADSITSVGVTQPEISEETVKGSKAAPVSKEDEELRRLNNWQQYLNLDDLDVIHNVDPFECGICLLDVAAGDGVQLRDCLHSFCCECLRNVVSHNEEATVCCPYRDELYSCDSILQEREIRALVPPDVFERYLRRSIATAESQAPNSFHCKTPDCPGWCLYADNANEFLCPSCGRLNCITCRVIHEGMNCRQYQDELGVRARTDDEAKKTKEAIDQMVQKGEAMKCPSCEVIVMKKWGCDWIVCSICKVEICWVTKGPRWGPKGRGDLSGGCKCGVNGVRCHPKCNYCH